MPVVASTADLAVHCPTCLSTNVGAAWTHEGELRMIACHACKDVWKPHAAAPVERLAVALEAERAPA